MDALNREILSLLQEDGRMSATDVARAVGLSLSSCHRRVKELEASGAIERYRAVVAPDAVGLRFEAIVFVMMNSSAPDVLEEFERAILELPDVVTGHRLFGEPDYMLRVLTRDLAAYQELYDRTLSALPGVQRLTSTIVMKRIGVEGTVPIP